MTIAKTRKLGFFAAMAMLVGSVVGVGIFFKNGSISRATDGNGYAWLFAWIVGGIISLMAAINYSEISFLKPSKLNGLANWAYRTGGKKAGYATVFNYSFYYLVILTLLLSIIASEVTVFFINQASGYEIKLPFWVHILIAIGFLQFFTILNWLSVKASGYVALTSTILKFVPLVVALFAGIFAATTYNDGGQSAFGNDYINGVKDATGQFIKGKEPHPFDFSKLILALPAVLFAYDSFLSVGSLHNKVDKAEKRVPLIIIVAMILIVSIYTLIALSSALHSKGSIDGLIRDAFPKSAAKPITIFVFAFLLISTYGVNNSVNAFFINQMKDLVNLDLIFGSKKIKQKFGKDKAVLFYLIFGLVMWGLITLIPSIAIPLPKANSAIGQLEYGYGSDVIADAMSNFPSLIFYGLYMAIMVLYMIKKYKNPTKLHSQLTGKPINKVLFWTSGVLASLLILIAVVAFVYSQVEAVVVKTFGNSSAGIFEDNGLMLTNLGSFLIFIFQLIVFFSFPLINYWLIKKFEKRCVLSEFEKNVELDSSSLSSDSQNSNIVTNVVKYYSSINDK